MDDTMVSNVDEEIIKELPKDEIQDTEGTPENKVRMPFSLPK